MTSAKFYSNKSNAKRAALAAGLVVENCTLETDGKGFRYVANPLDADGAPLEGNFAKEPEVLPFPAPEASKPSELAVLAAAAAGDQQGTATALLEALGIPATPRATEAPVTAGRALVQAITEGVEAGVAAEEAKPAKAAKERKGISIDKNRAEQNGIKRPSAGGICAKIWDECDRNVAAGHPPTIKGMKNWGTANGINLTTVTIQFYQWRAFNGIVGRQ